MRNIFCFTPPRSHPFAQGSFCATSLVLKGQNAVTCTMLWYNGMTCIDQIESG